MKNIFFTVFLILFSFSISAQQNIQTDRPDQTENTALVPKGRFQFESGIKHEQTASDELELELPEFLFKYGLSKRVELRLEGQFSYEKAEEENFGLYALQAGTKIKILPEKNGFPAVSFITQFQIPGIEASEFRTLHVAPELRVMLRNTLSKKVDLGYNAGVRWDGNSLQAEYFYTISPNVKLTDKLHVFVESFGNFPAAHHGHQWADGGMALRLGSDLQLDFALGMELSKTEGYHHFFESVGVSFRI
nr:transporter [uncultured Flavobacterium sp.]